MPHLWMMNDSRGQAGRLNKDRPLLTTDGNKHRPELISCYQWPGDLDRQIEEEILEDCIPHRAEASVSQVFPSSLVIVWFFVFPAIRCYIFIARVEIRGMLRWVFLFFPYFYGFCFKWRPWLTGWLNRGLSIGVELIWAEQILGAYRRFEK